MNITLKLWNLSIATQNRFFEYHRQRNTQINAKSELIGKILIFLSRRQSNTQCTRTIYAMGHILQEVRNRLNVFPSKVFVSV